MRLIALAAATLAAVTLATPAAARQVDKEWKQAWDLSGSPTVRVVTDDARVRIHRGPAGAVTARVWFRGRTWGVSSQLELPRVVLEQDGNDIRIEARERANWVLFGGIETKFEIDVTVPTGGTLSVRTSDGSIACEALEGRITLESSDGPIRTGGLRGALVLWSSDGDIVADSLEGSLLARTSDGNLKVAGRFDHLDLRTSDGRIDATAARGSTLARPWSLETSDGSLTLRIPRNLQALLDASTRDGRLKLDLPVSTRGALRDNTLHGALNGGEVPLRLRSSDGNITVSLSE